MRHSYLYYDIWPCMLMLTSVGSSVGLLLFLRVFTLGGKELQEVAKSWGSWSRHMGEASGGGIMTWQRGTGFSKGSVVAHGGVLYRSESTNTLVEPGKLIPRLVHILFCD